MSATYSFPVLSQAITAWGAKLSMVVAMSPKAAIERKVRVEDLNTVIAAVSYVDSLVGLVEHNVSRIFEL